MLLFTMHAPVAHMPSHENVFTTEESHTFPDKSQPATKIFPLLTFTLTAPEVHAIVPVVEFVHNP
jgi:hypothetical protein